MKGTKFLRLLSQSINLHFFRILCRMEMKLLWRSHHYSHCGHVNYANDHAAEAADVEEDNVAKGLIGNTLET